MIVYITDIYIYVINVFLFTPRSHILNISNAFFISSFA